MRWQTVCVLAVVVVCVAAAAPVQAGYISAVEGSNPFEYYQMQESNPVHATAAVNSGSTGTSKNGMYILTGGATGCATFTDVAGMTSEVSPAIKFTQWLWGDPWGAAVCYPRPRQFLRQLVGLHDRVPPETGQLRIDSRHD